MKQILTALLLALTFNSQAMAQQKTIKIRVVETRTFTAVSSHTTLSTASPRRVRWQGCRRMSTR